MRNKCLTFPHKDSIHQNPGLLFLAEGDSAKGQQTCNQSKKNKLSDVLSFLVLKMAD
jgi:hypothetical protein